MLQIHGAVAGLLVVIEYLVSVALGTVAYGLHVLGDHVVGAFARQSALFIVDAFAEAFALEAETDVVPVNIFLNKAARDEDVQYLGDFGRAFPQQPGDHGVVDAADEERRQGEHLTLLGLEVPHLVIEQHRESRGV